MFNPLAPWTERALKGFIEQGKRFFVRQNFPRGRNPFDEGIRGCFLICHYEVFSQAREHYDALRNDPARFLYDWENAEHRRRLLFAAAQPDGYRIFTNTFLPEWERHITERLKKKIRAYIQKRGWSPAREDGVLIDFYPHFGEVMISLRFREQKLSVKLEEIEHS